MVWLPTRISTRSWVEQPHASSVSTEPSAAACRAAAQAGRVTEYTSIGGTALEQREQGQVRRERRRPASGRPPGIEHAVPARVLLARRFARVSQLLHHARRDSHERARATPSGEVPPCHACWWWTTRRRSSRPAGS